eukprot:2345307-Amphidinium_carterae.1
MQPAPTYEYVQPAPTYEYIQPAPMYEYIQPAPVYEYIEPPVHATGIKLYEETPDTHTCLERSRRKARFHALSCFFCGVWVQFST